MLEPIFSIGLNLLAVATPVSIAATNIIFFPLAALWLLGAKKTFAQWPPRIGLPEKIFLAYIAISLVSACAGVNVRHSLREIKNEDLYLIILVVVVALVRTPEKNRKLLDIFMTMGFLMAVWGILQCMIGVNQSDKSGGDFYHLPQVLAQWPRPLLDHLSMVNGRVVGTRSHPLTYAECLLFNWAFAIFFLLESKGRDWIKWFLYLMIIGGGLLVSQSRGPWIAAGVMLMVGIASMGLKRSWILVVLGVLFLGIFQATPTLRNRAISITSSSHHSNRDRLEMWKAGLVLWKERPLFGVGPGNIKVVSPRFQTPHDRIFGPWGHLHSNYMNTLAERGTLGFLAFVGFLLAFCVELWQAYKRADPHEAFVYKSTGLALLGFFIGGVTETSYNSAVVMMMFYFILGLAFALARHEKVA